ncbi:MAG TPA: ADP-ribose pyrophosphatase, partial [Lachnospiraceae bacterium]|nr:ADP-ribose pyrophosphatase [Lachnospiraceae bacterium]
RYFSEEEISKLKLAEEKNNMEQIHMCFEAARTPNWKTQID